LFNFLSFMKTLFFAFLFCIANLFCPSQTDHNKKIGSTIRLYFTPTFEKSSMMPLAKIIERFLEQESGFDIEVVIPDSYADLIGDFQKGKVDMSFMNSMSFAQLHNSHGAQAKLRVVRNGSTTYFGQIIVRKSSGINDIKDIDKKIMAYTNKNSTSGYLYPKKMLTDNGVHPSKEVFAEKHDKVVQWVYEGKCDAGATFYSEPVGEKIKDARVLLQKKYPDVAEKVVTLTKTDPIPNDPIVFSKDIDKSVIYKLSLALIKLSTTSEGKSALSKLYGIEGFIRTNDADYNEMTQLLK
jgi:phosphonate transport system substrate-binding protein